MKLISKKEFIDWILSQPDEREVDMGACINIGDLKHRCGCVMLQYFTEKMPHEVMHCSYREFTAYDDESLQVGKRLIAGFNGFELRDIFKNRNIELQHPLSFKGTYKQIKENLIQL